MKKIVFTLSLFTVILIFTACPYESSVALGAQTEKCDPLLIGKWLSENNEYEYTISKKQEDLYAIERIETNSQKAENYLAYSSNVKGTIFLNIYNVSASADSRKYMFYKIVIEGKKLTAYPVTENVKEQFNKSMELNQFFATNMKNSYFFEKEMVMIKSE